MLTRPHLILCSIISATCVLGTSCATTVIERTPSGFRYSSDKDVYVERLEISRVGPDGAKESVRIGAAGGNASNVNAGWQGVLAELISRLPSMRGVTQYPPTSAAAPDRTDPGAAAYFGGGPDYGSSVVATASWATIPEPDRSPWLISSSRGDATTTLGASAPGVSARVDSSYVFSLERDAVYTLTLSVEHQTALVGASLPPGSPAAALQEITLHNEQGSVVLPVVILHTTAPREWGSVTVTVPALFYGAQLNAPGFGVSLRASQYTDVGVKIALRATLTASRVR